jgi:light-regulated signal transduction histidine kinase (bacteriophytochrome)
VIEGLLNFSKAGQNDVKFSEVNVESMLMEVKRLLSETIKEHKAEVVLGKMMVIYS